MKILAIETTGNVASVAIVDEKEIIAEFSLNHKKNHSVTIMPLAAYMLEMVESKIDDMDYIAVSCGPGSFTGLRIGAATAKALGHGAKKDIVPVPTLDSLAYNIFEENTIIAPIMDARRGQVYCSLYICENGFPKRIMPYTVQDLSRLFNELEAMGKTAVFTGDGIFSYREVILEKGHKIAPSHLSLQRASTVGVLAIKLAKDGKTVPYNNLELMYLRKPQAEREYEEKLINGGNSALQR